MFAQTIHQDSREILIKFADIYDTIQTSRPRLKLCNDPFTHLLDFNSHMLPNIAGIWYDASIQNTATIHPHICITGR